MRPIKKVLFVTSHDRDESAAIRRAVALAKSNRAALTLVSVVATPPGYSLLLKAHSVFKDLMDSEIAQTKKSLEVRCAQLRREADLNVRAKVFGGKMDLEVSKEVVRNGHDIVVKSSEQLGGPKRTLFGSADINLMRYCPCPVLIVKPTRAQSLKVIVAAVDRDIEAPENHLLNLQILELATWLAIADSSELHIVHSWTLPFESLLRSPRSTFPKDDVDALEEAEEKARSDWLDELVEEFERNHKSEIQYVKPQLHVIKGSAKLDIPAKTRELDADLIVMGTVGRVGVQGFLMGNTSETILQQVECSGLTVKPPGFSTSISE